MTALDRYAVSPQPGLSVSHPGLPLWAERRPLGPLACAQQRAERRRVDELRVAKVDDDPATVVQEDAELVLESSRGVRVVFSDQRNDSRWRIPGS